MKMNSGKVTSAALCVLLALGACAKKDEAAWEGESRAASAEYMPAPPPSPYYQAEDTERYQHLVSSAVKSVVEAPVSTFSIDVDTGSYTNVRRFLNGGRLPPKDAVRIEEMVNYFGYDYAVPKDRTQPFTVSTETAVTPWNADTLLLKVGLRGYDVPASARPAANLVFLLDVSGSMNAPDKLPLLVSAMRLLTNGLNESDHVSIVVYAGSEGVVLDNVPGSDKETILAALEELQAGGSTAGEAGIRLAYAQARKGFVKGGINRVILATDGDFNVGVSDTEQLKDLVSRNKDDGITLTTLGFGTGNYNEAMMEQIADVGNGNYFYVDTMAEAQKVLGDQLGSTLFTIAKDVKLQVEFNPAVVAEYRLIGYENRELKREDFNNDKVDAGDIGAGHRVTALYEVALVGSKGVKLPPLKYQEKPAAQASATEAAFLKLRYKLPDASESKLLEFPIAAADFRNPKPASADLQFAAAVAAYGQKLRGGEYLGGYRWSDIGKLASARTGKEEGEFSQLVKLAAGLSPVPAPDGR